MKRPHEKGVLVTFKDLVKRVLPPPVHAFNREVARILDAVEQNHQETDALLEMITAQKNSLDQLRRQLEGERARRVQWESQARDEWRAQQQAALDKALEGQAKTLAALSQSLEQSAAGLQKQTDALAEAFAAGREQMATRQQADALNKQAEVLTKQGDSLAKAVERARSQAADSARHASEAVWAQIFNNTISESLWLKDKTFSPGRWAVGYPYLYVMYRVLNETRPKRILELGLGQSTRMIAQYAAAFQDVEHIVVEHDPEWVEFFCNDFPLPKNTKVIMLEREMVPYKDADAVRVFKGFKETFLGQKFDFISVDAPLGADMKQYSRIDVLNLIPDGLDGNFAIMIDDCDRIGETHTVAEIENKLQEADVAYKRGRYSGRKDCVVICSERQGFLSSL